ncbi:hypothetical protein [Nonlabens xiamenensis]|uniref:hypothetical protein n=1 Tax=Nonlabens xiamenensis TaxID=2341043 RepID=UPI0013DE76FF|nr:hypothetical protein [Nonlabens xiamenensis]
MLYRKRNRVILLLIVLLLAVVSCKKGGINDQDIENKSEVSPIEKVELCFLKTENDTISILFGENIDQNLSVNKNLIMTKSDEDDISGCCEALVAKTNYDNVQLKQILYFRNNLLEEASISLRSTSERDLFKFIVEFVCLDNKTFTFFSGRDGGPNEVVFDFEL